jgi:hypothetical protein
MNVMEDGSNDNSDDENQDEKWLFYYMLGKISEKRKEIPENWLDMYSKVTLIFNSLTNRIG